MNPDPHWLQKAVDIKSAKTESFSKLFRISGLDRTRDFRASDWSDIDFSGCDLRGFDFTGSRVKNCNFKGARIHNARFDKAEINNSNLREAKDWNKYRNNWKRNPNPVSDLSIPTQSIFQDAPFAPELIIIPSGKFLMGSSDNEGEERERPQHEVTIDYHLAVGRFAVTFEEWDFYISRNPDAHKATDQGWGRDRRPVINVSWYDAQAYVKWLSGITGETYRLLSEAEWEYVCRAGEDTQYHFGDEEAKLEDYAWYNKNSDRKTQPVGQKHPNQFGLYDMHGNVSEWCRDQLQPNDFGMLEWKDENNKTFEPRAKRGGCWYDAPRQLRARYRSGLNCEQEDAFTGFRVFRYLTPQAPL